MSVVCVVVTVPQIRANAVATYLVTASCVASCCVIVASAFFVFLSLLDSACIGSFTRSSESSGILKWIQWSGNFSGVFNAAGVAFASGAHVCSADCLCLDATNCVA